ncbi:hemin uptake protein HemP [Yersinia frederiksenii]|uniref:hemin uptake protein HemP n=1 Tax=Yersinia frederiksenii TaxID=29484 RepID=UPI00005F8F20|nr:hemin uptake protein HemP [Yersinia frederiksenii]ATM95997.1 hemin uptake protein HemP [Yersinia frederiksenii]EEQ16540.1 Hemin uptake protein [Yersinia frederiksenii ATCC 33641]
MHIATYLTQTLNAATDQTPPQGKYPCVNSQQLLGQHDVVAINHQGQLYYLRQTKAGKLILTK